MTEKQYQGVVRVDDEPASAITLRDYFAAEAVGVQNAQTVANMIAIGDVTEAVTQAHAIAKGAYMVADAMLKAREATHGV